MTEDQILQDFPDPTREDIRACLAFTADRERKIVRFQQYVDTWQVAQATGVTPKS
jgi:hypothetical protein